MRRWRSATKTQVDLVLLDIMMPGIDGFEVCERLKANAATRHISRCHRHRARRDGRPRARPEAGADDFLTKPVNETAADGAGQEPAAPEDADRRTAAARRNRARYRHRRRCSTASGTRCARAKILLIDERAPASQDRLVKPLRRWPRSSHAADPQAGRLRGGRRRFRLRHRRRQVRRNYDPLRLCSQLRSLERTRFVPIMLVADAEDEELIERALELGVNDYIVRPVDPNELIARCADPDPPQALSMTACATTSPHTIELAVTDGLTGLHNRRYLDTHLETLVRPRRSPAAGHCRC